MMLRKGHIYSRACMTLKIMRKKSELVKFDINSIVHFKTTGVEAAGGRRGDNMHKEILCGLLVIL